MRTIDEHLREQLLAPEYHTGVRLSPDGQSVAVIRTTARGPEIVLDDRLLAAEHDQTVTDLRWAADGSALYYRRALRGTEKWQLVRLEPGGAAEVVPAAGPVAEFWTAGDRVAFAAGGVLHVSAPGREPDQVSADRYHRWLVDRELRPRGGIRLQPDGGLHLVVDGAVRLALGPDDSTTFAVVGFAADGRTVYLLSAHDAPTRRLLALECATGRQHTVFAHPDLDVEGYPIGGPGVWCDPRTGEPDICQTVGQRPQLHGLGRPTPVFAVGPDEAMLLLDRSTDDSTWLTVRVRSDGPIRYELVAPDTGATRPLLVNRPGLAGRRLPRLDDLHVTAGDGVCLHGYAMRPLDTTGPLPTVVIVHGGPAGRDYFRFHALAQYVAALGFQSLHVNYRGSRGFGTAFRRAGDGEWGGRMQQDLYDAIADGARQGLVDPDRVALLGASYGGYAALLAACTRPDLVRCAVAFSPPCDLAALVGDTPAYWRPLAATLHRHILGDHPADADWLRGRSPRHLLSPDAAPMLIAHGARDPRVPVAQAEDFVAAADRAAAPVTYLRLDGEGHHVTTTQSRRVLFRRIEEFLEVHLVHDHRTAAPAPAIAVHP
ncbi:alpha/beta fold hydrolase [Actinoplanes sp. NEAU-A12]|uniref:Alpha/beta fold hydrolase n=1 Tax=Actinoplanes sandaracinus TaxID=3045177 RepID=A0ABT6WYM2_9ACTN|nr:alpha/beta fold hydrolase [Actinoplanes sandaracinus]MDI6104838.1 alpha/beta fold hydrolase [Actinoplanes sandaracinus]